MREPQAQPGGEDARVPASPAVRVTLAPLSSFQV